MSEIRKLAPVQERVETGAVEFGEDWPGLFIRGDNCIAYLMCLQGIRHMLKRTNPSGLMEHIHSTQLDGLIELFSEPIVHPNKDNFLKKMEELQDLT
jgi:hypothetical protein